MCKQLNEMAEKLELDRTTLTLNVKPLAHQGLLTIAPGSDQRTRVVTLTPEGEARPIKSITVMGANAILYGRGDWRSQRIPITGAIV